MSHDDYQIHRAKILTPSFWVLLTLSVIGFALIAVRFIWGIGAVSNMSDGYPWGIWITYDVATGTAQVARAAPRRSRAQSGKRSSSERPKAESGRRSPDRFARASRADRSKPAP